MSISLKRPHSLERALSGSVDMTWTDLAQAAVSVEQMQRATDGDEPWPTRPYPFALLGAVLCIYRDLREEVLVRACIGVLFPSLYAIELEGAQEANTERNRYGLPLDFGVFEGRV